jgi:hypothetical protein
MIICLLSQMSSATLKPVKSLSNEKRVIMFTKIFIRTFPSTEECELFESILQTRWPELIGKADGVRFTAWRNPQTPHISTVIWEFPDEQAQRTIEKLIDEHISKFTKTLSPKTITFSGERKMELTS